MMSKFKSILFLFCLFSFSSVCTFSQKIFRDGYIVKISGELFEGVVAFNPGNKIPSKCIFKRFDIAVEISYGPDDLKAFGYKNGRRYESIETDGKKVFFETLVSGELNLYRKGSGYCLVKTGLAPVHVQKGAISWEDEKGKKIFAEPGELLIHLAEIAKVPIGEKPEIGTDLKQIVVAYNRISGKRLNIYTSEVSEKELAKTAWHSGANSKRVGVVAGLNFYSLSLISSKDYYIPVPELERAPVFGVSYEKMLSRKSDNFCFHGEILFMKQTFYSFSESINYDRFVRDDAFFDFTAMKAPILLQYSFGSMRIIPFVNGGFAGTVFLQNHYIHINETESYDRASIYTKEDSKLVIVPFEFSAALGAGFSFRLVNNMNLRLEGRFEIGSGLFSNKDKDYKQHSKQQSIILGVNF